MSLIIKNSNLVYLHIPKTGGDFLRNIFNINKLDTIEYGHKHSSYDHFHNLDNHQSLGKIKHYLIKKLYIKKNLIWFSTIRNPINWYESVYKYFSQRNWRSWGQSGDQANWHVMSDLNIFSDLNTGPINDFNEFIRIINNNYPGFYTQLIGKYSLNSKIIFLKIENIEFELKNFLSSVDIELTNWSNKKINKSEDFKIEWDKENLSQTIENDISIFKKYKCEF